MTSGFISYTDGYQYQIVDNAEAMVYLRRAEEKETHSGECLVATGANARYLFGPISQASIPSHGAGLEVYNAEGRLMYSSLVPPMASVGIIKTNVDNPVVELQASSGRRYAVMLFSAGRQAEPVNIRELSDPLTLDKYYTYSLRERYISYDLFDWGIRTKIATENSGPYDSPEYPQLVLSHLPFEAVLIDVTAID